MVLFSFSGTSFMLILGFGCKNQFQERNIILLGCSPQNVGQEQKVSGIGTLFQVLNSRTFKNFLAYT